ncbi:MAG: hypothetical protein V1789_03710 [PVC group bacterium]
MKNSRIPIGEMISSGVVLIASFMPWGSFKSTVRSPFGGGSQFSNIQITSTINGWNGSLTLLGITIPNWLVVVVALAVTVMAVCRQLKNMNVPPLLSILFSAYGLVHCGVSVSILGTKGTLGIGSLLSLAGFVSLIILSIKALSHNELVQPTS